MKKYSVNSLRFSLRKPYRIVLCALVNAVLLVFCFVEGGQWLLAGSTIAAARENQVYLGTLTPRADPIPETIYDGLVIDGYDGDKTYVPEEVMRHLKDSPYVRETHVVRASSAKLDSGIWMPSDNYYDANNVFFFVGRVASKIQVRHTRHGTKDDEAAERGEIRLNITPLCVSAGYEKHLTIPPTEASGIPILSIPDRESYSIDSETGEIVVTTEEAQDYGLEEGGRYLFSVTGYGTAAGPLMLYFFEGPDGPLPAVYAEEPGDEALSDEEFGKKVLRGKGLSEIAASLANASSLVTVQEIDAVDTLPIRQKELMRIMTGRELTREDAGKNVCILHVSDAAGQGLRVGKTIRLALSDGIYSSWNHGSGVPIAGDTRIFDYGPTEEFEVVGLYTYTEQPLSFADAEFGASIQFVSRYRYPRGTVLIPTREHPEGDGRLPTIYDFSYTIHKDDLDAFIREETGPLGEMGYDPFILTANYADVEAELEELEKNSANNAAVGLIGLAAGLAVSIALPLLFWRKDYAAERRMGASRQEARGVYRSAWILIACFSVLLAAAGLFALSFSSDALFPPVLRSAEAAGVMSLSALGELALLLSAVLLISFFRDRKQFWN